MRSPVHTIHRLSDYRKHLASHSLRNDINLTLIIFYPLSKVKCVFKETLVTYLPYIGNHISVFFARKVTLFACHKTTYSKIEFKCSI